MKDPFLELLYYDYINGAKKFIELILGLAILWMDYEPSLLYD